MTINSTSLRRLHFAQSIPYCEADGTWPCLSIATAPEDKSSIASSYFFACIYLGDPQKDNRKK